MTAEDFARAAEALATLIWPLLALAVAVALLPVLREIARQRQFTIKVGSFELSAQQAADQLTRQIEDLQGKLAELDARTENVRTFTPSPRTTRRSLSILWIDDRPANNAVEIAGLEAEGHRVITATGSEEAAAILRRQHIDVVLSDISRSLRGREGIEFMHDMREGGDMRPVGFYTSARALERHAETLSDSFIATSSFVELMAALRNLSTKDSDADEVHP